ncbi:MAG: hypothetical protein LUQ07_03540, partial [Methanospirillum sp.]|nr:hypothetical protein [Methanospirillum sp.]
MSTQKTLADIFAVNQPSEAPPADNDLFISPTVSLSNQFKKELTRRGIPFNPDRITTLQEFCRRYHAEHGEKTRIISEGQARIVMVTTLEGIREEIPFFFSQGYPSPGTVSDLYSLRSIISQRCIDFASHPLITTSEKCRQISRAITSYKETLAANRLLDLPALIEWTTGHISSQPGTLFGSVRIHRLPEIMEREKRLILAIKSHSVACRFEYPKGKDATLFSPPDWVFTDEIDFIEPTPEFFSLSDLFAKKPEAGPEGLLNARVFRSSTEELESIAEEIHALAGEGTPLSDIAITFPELSSRISTIQDILDDFGVPYHSSVGEPLIREPVVGFLLLFPLLAMEAYPREAVISLISSPFCAVRQPELPGMDIASFDTIVRTAGIEGGSSWREALLALKNPPEDHEFSPGFSDAAIDSVIAWIEAIQQDCNRFTERLTLPGYLAVFRQICRRWMMPEIRTGKPGGSDPGLSREQKAYGQFMGCLARLRSLFEPDEIVELSQFRRFLACLLEEPVSLSEDSGGV